MLQSADSVFRIDPGRISAGVVTGIGFLGAGAIVRSHDIVRGLTTAACIWFAAAVGIVVGCGLYLSAVIASGTSIGTLFTLFVVPTMYTYLAKNRTVQVQATGEMGGEKPG